jgi:transcription elongation factor GreA
MKSPAGVLTPTSRQRLEDELDQLVQIERPALVRRSRFTDGSGDAADHAGTYDVLVELGRVDSRIAKVRELLSDLPVATGSGQVDEVAPGSIVTLTFGDEDESERYFVGSIEELADDLDVITLSSPLGKALIGHRVGDTVEYRTPTGVHAKARVLGIE